MEFNNLLEGVAGDPEKVGNIVFALGLNQDDLVDHAKTGRVHEVINYLVNTPNPDLLITKLTTGKQVDKVDHIWSYFKVYEQKKEIDMQLSKSTRELEQLTNLRQDLQSKSDTLAEQITYY